MNGAKAPFQSEGPRPECADDRRRRSGRPKNSGNFILCVDAHGVENCDHRYADIAENGKAHARPNAERIKIASLTAIEKVMF